MIIKKYNINLLKCQILWLLNLLGCSKIVRVNFDRGKMFWVTRFGGSFPGDL